MNVQDRERVHDEITLLSEKLNASFSTLPCDPHERAKGGNVFKPPVVPSQPSLWPVKMWPLTRLLHPFCSV